MYDYWLMITENYIYFTYTSVWQYIIPYPILIWRLNMIIALLATALRELSD